MFNLETKMINRYSVKDQLNYQAQMSQMLKFKNPVKMNHFRGGKLIGVHDCFNDITNEGVNTLFNVMFNSATQIAQNAWYIGFVDNAGSPALNNADVMNSHAGWTEFTAYSQSTRVSWTSITASAGVRTVTNSSACVFNINGGGGTIYGIFVTSGSAKSGTTGKLWATAAFASPVPVSSGDQLNITYTTSA
jgi:hypothetical protein